MFREYAEEKEKRLRETLKVLEPRAIAEKLSPKMFRSGRAGKELVEGTNSVDLLLEECQHSRIISAAVRLGFPFYTERLQNLRNELYKENYGLVCKAVWSVCGMINSDLVSIATIAFLESLDNILPNTSGKPTTYVYSYVRGRLLEAVTRAKGGVTLYHYLKNLCGFDNAKSLIVEGKVSVNGRVCYNLKHVVCFDDEITVEGDAVSPVLIDFSHEETADVAVADSRVERKELWRIVERVVGEENLEVVYMYAAGLSPDEIAEELGVPLNAVIDKISLTLGILRERRDEFADFSP